MTQQEESLAWFQEQERKAALPKDALPEALSLSDFRHPPDWYIRECEYEERRGFHHGYEQAIADLLMLSRSGFGRVKEVANIMNAHNTSTIRAWMREAWTFDIDYGQAGFEFSPDLKHRPWGEIRAETFRRDGHLCMRCDSSENLEAHHLVPVSEGGLPELSNLTTLCEICHRGSKQAESPDRLEEETADRLLIPVGQLTGFPWEWVCGQEDFWQAMPHRMAKDDDFWWWHMRHRRQWFRDRRFAVASIFKSFQRYRSILPAV